MDETCECGHEMDEHECQANGAYGTCQVEGCDCCYFEEADDGDMHGEEE